MGRSMQRLSSGLRINSALDDAAGLAISSKMTSQVRGLNQAVRNANDAISMIQVAEGATQAVTDMLQRMRELAVQAVSDSNTDSDRSALRAEVNQLVEEIGRISDNTQWNGTQLLDGSTYATPAHFQVGSNANQTVAVEMADLSHSSSSSVFGVDLEATIADVGLKNLTLQRLSDQDTSITYTGGGWYKDGIRAYDDHNKDLTHTTVNGDSFSHTFEGTGIKYIAPRHAGYGNVEIFIDDVSQGVFSSQPEGSGYEPQQIIFETSGLTVGSHTIKGVKIDNNFLTVDGFNITPNPVLHRIDQAISNLNTYRSTLGASQNRLEYAADNLTNIAQNTQAARSRILDTDYASESTELARTQILQQAGTAMLAQANTQAQVVTSLLP